MKTYLTLSAIALAAAATLSSGAMAQTAPAEVPSVTITPNIGITSDYRFRGLSQNNKNPALQGGVDVAFKEGFYLGTGSFSGRVDFSTGMTNIWLSIGELAGLVS